MSVRVTRSQTGKTPSKPSHPGFVETPGYRKRRTRQSTFEAEELERAVSTPTEEDSEDDIVKEIPNGKANGHINGKTNGQANGQAISKTSEVEHTNPIVSATHPSSKVESHEDFNKADHFEFGGPWGVSALMIGFPALMYYMWIGATFYDGKPPLPQDGQSFQDFAKEMADIVYEHAYPHKKAWAIYWTFFVFEMFCYMYMPGIYVQGRPLPSLGGKKLDYYCSAMWSLYVTIAVAATLHLTGLFPLYTIMDEFGPLMSVAILTGFLNSFITYVQALVRGAQTRMTGSHVYDFFMGAELNPRLFYWLDFKMFYEVRIPWFILLLLSLGTAVRQYENYGYVSGEVIFLCMAHFLYANACSKAEQLIVPTWDMYYEKLGFLLTFWNLAGVPLSYCHCTIYLANHHPDEYRWNRVALTGLFIAYLFVYWVWDTCNSQKNIFRGRERGTFQERYSFPQLPWKEIKNPKSIPTSTGDSLLCDGWYGKARKIHYTCDLFFSLSWAAITGFTSPFPWFYPLFFSVMIIHRARRDIARCEERYGDAWREYTKRVPWLFVPGVF
ncbi:c-24(28) sterol reductase [Patellaria atrata CBS 101060]|uniref:Delta(24(24(1)))-sterol reductase n=1 Tax=Patellaria atrata CBS 101060 TaxID=1346257 RepID=A0A9P4SAM3_9PEZI|nr:c-24(28) sterol reductase [Patellaria atrata CBS 101060]